MSLRKARELVLIIGPCGVGKTTYAQQHYPTYARPEREAMIRALHPEGKLVYYPAFRRASAAMQRTAVQTLLHAGVALCLTVGGTTRQERAEWIQMAQAAGYGVQAVRLLAPAETVIARAQADSSRPRSSRSCWSAIVLHWFAAFEPVDAAAEGLTSYQEVEW